MLSLWLWIYNLWTLTNTENFLRHLIYKNGSPSALAGTNNYHKTETLTLLWFIFKSMIEFRKLLLCCLFSEHFLCKHNMTDHWMVGFLRSYEVSARYDLFCYSRRSIICYDKIIQKNFRDSLFYLKLKYAIESDYCQYLIIFFLLKIQSYSFTFSKRKSFKDFFNCTKYVTL